MRPERGGRIVFTSLLSLGAQSELVSLSGTNRGPRVLGGAAAATVPLPGVGVTMRTAPRSPTLTAARLALHVSVLVPARPLASGHRGAESDTEHETVESDGRLKSVRFTDVLSTAHAILSGVTFYEIVSKIRIRERWAVARGKAGLALVTCLSPQQWVTCLACVSAGRHLI